MMCTISDHLIRPTESAYLFAMLNVLPFQVSQAEVDSLKQALHTTEQKLSFEISLMRDEKNLTQTQLQKKTAVSLNFKQPGNQLVGPVGKLEY